MGTKSPDYSRFSQSINVPFTAWSPDHNMAITVTVTNKSTNQSSDVDNVCLDTGSAIFALSKRFVPDFPTGPELDQLPDGKVAYTSDTVWKGKWFPLRISFEGENKVQIVSEIEALVVTDESYQNTHYMGIGFGIYNEVEVHNDPGNNPMLAVKQYNGEPIDTRTFRRGYILHKRSVEIGLTAENTKDFKYMALTRSLPNDATRKPEWFCNRPSCAIRIKGIADDWHSGAALIDTGVWFMDINIPGYQGPKEMTAGVDVDIRFPDQDSDLPGYSFKWSGVWGDGNPQSITVKPPYDKSETKAFVNTSQSLYDRLVTLYDPEGAVFGTRGWTELETTEDARLSELERQKKAAKVAEEAKQKAEEEKEEEAQ
ncbi:hypothetical protein PV08_02380 [Exophiala spinifera]|uniref:Peptidase A1 domain-containing protein n=1 Tax=Exophiala spinifera TaxID=91928 RepID=A0A0D2BGI4_9EURO|nr:uncharacterized protein PV08_02380 [Exophiala spinifera]KIW18093.1 hypothetical protein PV08_02380 [Exophiala spinifera]